MSFRFLRWPRPSRSAASPPVMGQSADGQAPTALALTAESAPVLEPAALKPAYHLSTSIWPQQVVAAAVGTVGRRR